MKARLAAVLAVVLVVSACGSSSGSSGDEKVVNVFAAASLTEAFSALEKRFEKDHPGADVRLNLAGSSRLAQQIKEGAPADVFASANEQNMGKISGEGLAAGDPLFFAFNKLTIAVQPGNPEGIHYFPDLMRPDLTVVACAPEVPCGAATALLEHNTGVDIHPASEEQDVKAVLTKVEAGEADAGMVYVTDVVSAGDKVTGVPFARATGAINNYPIAVLADAPHPGLAAQFRNLVMSETGKQELRKVGFGTR